MIADHGSFNIYYIIYGALSQSSRNPLNSLAAMPTITATQPLGDFEDLGDPRNYSMKPRLLISSRHRSITEDSL